MSKRISKRVREEAALICAIAANRGEPISVSSTASMLYGVDSVQAARRSSAKLAVEAWAFAAQMGGRYDADQLRDDYAEAEALLRTGWEPSK